MNRSVLAACLATALLMSVEAKAVSPRDVPRQASLLLGATPEAPPPTQFRIDWVGTLSAAGASLLLGIPAVGIVVANSLAGAPSREALMWLLVPIFTPVTVFTVADVVRWRADWIVTLASLVGTFLGVVPPLYMPGPDSHAAMIFLPLAGTILGHEGARLSLHLRKYGIRPAPAAQVQLRVLPFIHSPRASDPARGVTLALAF